MARKTNNYKRIGAYVQKKNAYMMAIADKCATPNGEREGEQFRACLKRLIKELNRVNTVLEYEYVDMDSITDNDFVTFHDMAREGYEKAANHAEELITSRLKKQWG